MSTDVVVKYRLNWEDGVGAREYEVTANGQPVGFCGRYRRAGETRTEHATSYWRGCWRWWCDHAPGADYPTRKAAVDAALDARGVQLQLDLVSA